MTSSSGLGSGSLSMSEHPDIKGLARHSDRFTSPASYLHTLALLAGAYAAISAWIVGFEDQSPLAVADLVVGLGVVLLSFALLREHVPGLTAAYSLMGVWLIIAPWVVQNIDHSTAVIVSNVVVGAIIAATGAAALTVGSVRISRRA